MSEGYDSATKVLHLGNVANTGANLVDHARSRGRMWALRNIPAAPSLTSPKAWVARGKDALNYTFRHARPDLVHVHYGPNGYYGTLKRVPFILHLHGTDLREDLHRPLLGDLERHAMKRAAKVIVATPDLLEAAQAVRSDAIFVPNPTPKAALEGPPPPPPVPGRVVFSARWDDTKGGMPIVEAARALTEAGVDVVGVDWGDYSRKAEEAGVRLFPKMTPEDYRQFLASGQVVVGQDGVGSLGISELEAMAAGRPLVTYADPDREENPPVQQCHGDTLAQQVRYLLDNPEEAEALGEAGRNWVHTYRTPDRTLEILENVYGEVL